MATDQLRYLRKLFNYDVWANRETLLSIKAAVPCPDRSLKWMSHIIGAETLWLKRLNVNVKPKAVWPEMSIQDCEAELEDLARVWDTYFDILTLEMLDESVTYTNSLNQPWSSRVEDVLTHVTMHSSYHRGQIASDLRLNGKTPAYTDYIHAIRQGFVQ